MHKSVKMKTCKAEGCENKFTPSFSTLQKYCSSQCTYDEKKRKNSSKSASKPKNRQSKKTASISRKYTPQRKEYLQRPWNKNCVIKSEKCTGLANTIEHSRGRGDYYVDEWAEENEVPLTLDERFWKPACLNCNLELENNAELSRAHQLSKIHGGKKI